MLSADEQAAAVARWKNDPVLFVEEVLGVETLEPWQRSGLEAIRDNDRISFKACHDVGKTWLMARAFLWFFITRYGSKVLTTAPTWAQVEKLLWAEINTAVKNSRFPLGGRCLNTEYKISDDWFAIGLSPRNEVNSGEGQGKTSSFQGFHAPAIMVIFDEATGVRPQVWDLAEGNLTSGEVKFIAIGNPTSRSSRFYDTFRDITWTNVSIPCFVSPNFKANKIFDYKGLEKEYNYLLTLDQENILARLKSYKTVNAYLLSLRWSMEKALKWGLKHPLFVSKVLGEFPADDENALIPLSIVERAQNREVIGGNEGVRTIGADIARFGTDLSVFTELVGLKHTRTETHAQADVAEVVDALINFGLKSGEDKETHIAIDVGNMGAGVIDFLKRAIKARGLSWKVYEIPFGAGFQREQYPKGIRGDEAFKNDKEHFVNQKARMFSLLAEDLRERISVLKNVMDGTDDVYQTELPDIQYKLNSKSKIQIESKEEYKSRTGKGSPDYADSLALANYARYIKGAVFNYRKLQKAKKRSFTGDGPNKDVTSRGLKRFKVKF